MSVDLGCSPACGSLLCPSACIIGGTPGPAIRAWDLGRDVPPEPPWARPPKQGGLGWKWTLGKTAHFAGTKLVPSMILHRSTKLGTLAQRRGMGVGMVEQTRTPAARLRAKAHSADAFAAANTRRVSPWRVGRCLMRHASPLDQTGLNRMKMLSLLYIYICVYIYIYIYVCM